MKTIIADSCCDLTPEMKEEMGIVSVPLTMILGDKEYCDDDTLDVAGFVNDMKQYDGKPASAAPSPYLFKQAIADADDAYVITLSSKLSATYNNAVMGKVQAEEESDAVKAHIFDSKSAAAGETAIAIKLHELIKSGLTGSKLIEALNRYIDEMKTIISLENYDNLRRNGRLNRIQGLLVNILNLKLIMSSDGNGEIMLLNKCRGENQKIDTLLSIIEKSGRAIKENFLVITHVFNAGLAEKLRDMIKERFDFGKIYVVQSRGLTSLYADDKGIVLAF